MTAPLVTVDEAYDLDYASDGSSRFGAYLRQRRLLFSEDGELTAVRFAELAWQVACPPLMCPGYVRRRADIEDVCCWNDGDRGILFVDIEVRLRIPGLLDGLAAGWATWIREQSWVPGPAALLEPSDRDRAVLVTANVRVPLAEGDLVEPKLTRLGTVDVSEAKTAVAIVCRHVNETAGPVVEHLRDVRVGGRR